MLRVEGLTIRADSNEGILGGDGNVLPSFSNGHMPICQASWTEPEKDTASCVLGIVSL